MTALLELEDVEARYGPVQALHGVSLAVEEGEIAAVLGANGAGKTSTLRAISGTVRRSGEIRFAGESIVRRGPEATARLGIAHVPEGRGIFPELTVWENLRLGAYVRRGRLDGDLRAMVARALMQRPRLLLLDEPSLGLAPKIVAEIFRIVRELNERDGLTVLVVEQNAVIALDAASRAFVLEVGRVALAGESADLRADESVRKSYLGY